LARTPRRRDWGSEGGWRALCGIWPHMGRPHERLTAHPRLHRSGHQDVRLLRSACGRSLCFRSCGG
jgi:hypothetical protein